MGKTSGIGKAFPKNFKKARRGHDQAFTLQRGTSAAPIMQKQVRRFTTKRGTKGDAFMAGVTGAAVHGEITKALKKKPTITKKGWGRAYKRG